MMFENRVKLPVLALVLLPVALLGCETGRGYPEHDEVTATLQRILDDNPTLTCTETEVLNESGAGATYRYYTARTICSPAVSTGPPSTILKYYELRYDRVPDGWRFKMYREVEKAFAEDPESRGPSVYTEVPGASRIVWLALGIPTGLILVVLTLWALGDRYRALPAVARRLRLSRNKQPHQKKHFDSINPLD